MRESDDPARWIYVIEPDAAGHHLLYASIIAREALTQGRGAHLVVDAGSTKDSVPFASHLAPLLREPACRLSDVKPTAWSVFRAVRRALRDQHADAVVVPDADRWLIGLLAAHLIAGRTQKLRLLIVRPSQQDASSGARVRFFAKRMCARLIARSGGARTIGLLAVPGTDWSAGWPKGCALLQDVNLVAQGDYNQAEARRFFGIQPDVEIVLGLLGVLTRRKNPRMAAEAARIVARTSQRRTALLCVGPVEDDSASDLKLVDPVQLVHVAQFVSEADLSRALAACDVVLCLYTNEGSSGIVTAALAHDVPVVAAGAQGVTAMVEKLGAGTCAALDAASVGAAVLHELSRYGQRTIGTSEEHYGSIVDWAVSIS